MKFSRTIWLFLALSVAMVPGTGRLRAAPGAHPRPPVKLYWFVPDGMRAEPHLFNIYRWAEEGKLPHIRQMMKRGAYGYCQPTFPSHTPANFATMFTGAYPEVHGVNDGPMRVEGHPLASVSLSGFSSTAKKIEPIWVTLERLMKGQVALLSVPGSTPPELDHGLTVRGRWGRWGADFHAVIFQDAAAQPPIGSDPDASRLFFNGPPLTQRVTKGVARGWEDPPRSGSPLLEADLTAWGATLHALIYDRTRDGRTNYDRIAFSADRRKILCTLKAGQWSAWLPISLLWSIPERSLNLPVASHVKIKLIRLDPDGQFRIRLFFDNLNKHLTEPEDLAADLEAGVGPMVDFVDNFPPQLIHDENDKATFLEEADMSLDWHRRAARFLLKTYQPDVYIQNIYTPNQMLTSRWWMGYLDPSSDRYGAVSEKERARLWQEVQGIYRKLDAIVGELMRRADANTVVALSSDHGAIPLNKEVRLNNLFAKEGLLTFRPDPQTGANRVDWEHTRVVYLKMHAVYLHPQGLAGNWQRGSGPEYEALRDRVRTLLLDLKDAEGIRPVVNVTPWEKAAEEFRLLPERTGDLVIANRAGYGWSEQLTPDLEVFSVPLKTGYKQAVLAGEIPGMWTPFMIMGPGVAPGTFLGDKPIPMVDQYPTLFHLLGQPTPSTVQGTIVRAALQP